MKTTKPTEITKKKKRKTSGQKAGDKKRVLTIQKRQEKLKLKFLELFPKNLGHISATCKAIKIDRSTYYKWIRNDEAFRQGCLDAEEEKIDHAEAFLFKEMKAGNTACIIFFLKTKAKKRGYIEKQEIEHSGEMFRNVSINIIKK